MYNKYFGFNEKPFTLTPNPRFIYLSKYHKEAFAHLLYGINNHYGFIELIGEVGTGKTTVLRTLLGQLQEENYKTALIFNPCLTGVELLRSICHEFGLTTAREYANELLADFNNFLLQETAAGRTVVLVIDESQNLKPEVLEQIRLISNLETEDDKLIQIVLAGQPELAELLQRPELRQLNQRIAVRYRLKSMNQLETKAYIRHRMEIAGEKGGVSFSHFAYRWIYLYTRGVPRMINILCDRCLLIAYGNEQRRITANTVTKAIREVLNIAKRPRLPLYLILAGVVAVLSAVLWFRSTAHRTPTIGTTEPATRYSSATSTVKPKPASTAPSIAPVNGQAADLQREILSYNRDNVHLLAFNALAESWGALPVNVYSESFSVPSVFSKLAQRRNLKVTEFKGSLDEVLRLNIPFLAVTTSGKTGNSYCLAVTSVTQKHATIAPTLFDQDTVPLTDLAAISNGTFYLVWQNYGQIPDKLTLGSKRFEIRSLQTLLHSAGMYNGSIDGVYSSATVNAVLEFQQKHSIRKNESVGELTLAALSPYYSNKKIPRLAASGSRP